MLLSLSSFGGLAVRVGLSDANRLSSSSQVAQVRSFQRCASLASLKTKVTVAKANRSGHLFIMTVSRAGRWSREQRRGALTKNKPAVGFANHARSDGKREIRPGHTTGSGWAAVPVSCKSTGIQRAHAPWEESNKASRDAHLSWTPTWPPDVRPLRDELSPLKNRDEQLYWLHNYFVCTTFGALVFD